MTTTTKRTTLGRIVVPFQVKAAADTAARTFEGLSATWALDLGRDVIHKGAFKDSIAEWKDGGEALPLLNSHDHWNIMSALGQLIDAAETKDGLWSKWEVIDGPEGDAVLTRLRPSATTGRPTIGKMSIGFEPQMWEMEQPEGTTGFWDQIRHLTKIAWKETSLVLFPMQPGAAIDASTVKAFLAETQATDPALLDVETKQGLRILASRIGTLLKKQEPTPSTKATETVGDVEATEDESAHSADPADSAGTSESDAPATPATDTTEKAAPALYVYPDALMQRLTAIRLRHKRSAIGA